MAIPLVGSPPPAKRPTFPLGRDLVSGNSRTFATGVGNWTNTGGTLSWNTTSNYRLTSSLGSLKFVTTAGNQSVSLSVPGTFAAGVKYHARLSFLVEEMDVYPPLDTVLTLLTFGDSGAGDVASDYLSVGGYYGLAYGSKSYYLYALVEWTPSVARSAVTVKVMRVNQTPDPTHTFSLHIGDCRVMACPAGEMGLTLQTDPSFGRGSIVPQGVDFGISQGMDPTVGPSYLLDRDGFLVMKTGDGNSEFGLTPGDSWLYVIPPDASNQHAGSLYLDIEVGYDWVGFGIGELNETTAQLIPYQDISLLERAALQHSTTTRRWYLDTLEGQRINLANVIESPFSAAGDLLVGATRDAQVGWSTNYLTPGRPTMGFSGSEQPMYLPNWGYGVFQFEHVPIGPVTFHYDFWFSQYSSSTRGMTVRLRRDSPTGAVLVTQTYDGAEGNFLDGHRVHWVGSYEDAAPTTGKYVLTRSTDVTQCNGHSDTAIAYFTGTVPGVGAALPKGTDGQILAVDPATHNIMWKSPEQAHFQWPFYVPGTLVIGADKAVYFQVPDTCAIDEVRVHVGTAPTGTSLIVDVNDDGTTIFTTQGNRPEVAISGTDDTSGVPDGGTSVAKDSVLTIDLDQVGSTIAGADLVVFVRGHYIW